MQKKSLLAVATCLTVFCSCEEKVKPEIKDKIDYSKQKTVIPSSLRNYVDTFVEEGKKRGITIDLEKEHFVMDFGDLVSKNLSGLTDYKLRKITIDNNFKSWPENELKQTVFHELGHLLLKRGHDDSVMENGETNSLMHSRSKCIGPIFYGKERYDYYFDELFKPLETSEPTWSKLTKYNFSTTNSGKILFESNFKLMLDSWVKEQGVNKFTVSDDRILQIENVTSMGFDLAEMLPTFSNFEFKNYEIRYKYKLYDAPLNVFWGINKTNSFFAVDNPETYAMIARYTSSVCPDITNFSFGKLNKKEFNVSSSVKHNLNAWNELIFRVEKNRIYAFLNGDLFFQSDYDRVAPILNPTLRLVFGVGKYEIEYINIYEI